MLAWLNTKRSPGSVKMRFTQAANWYRSTGK